MNIDKRLDIRDKLSSHKCINFSFLKEELQFNLELFDRESYLALVYDLVNKIENGGNLSVQESEILFLSVIATNNKDVYNTLFRNSFSDTELKKLATIILFEMRFKEERWTLTSDEIIWMLLASKYDLSYEFFQKEWIIETGWMGGDKWFTCNNAKKCSQTLEQEQELSLKIRNWFSKILEEQGSLFDYYDYLSEEIVSLDRKLKASRKARSYKTINISTLTSLFLSKLDTPVYVMKHWSWKNTSAVGSTDAAVNLGITVLLEDISQYEKELRKKKFVYTDAKIFKSLHDISWTFIKTETINHLIGPLTPPISYLTPYYKILWINHNVNVDVLWQTFEKMNKYKLYNTRNALIIGGLDKNINNYYSGIEKDIKLDEFSPISTIFWLVVDWKYIGKGIIKDEDFWVKINIKNILLPNDEHVIFQTNKQVLRWTANEDLINLVVINIVLGKILLDLDKTGLNLTDLVLNLDTPNNLKFNSFILRQQFQKIKNLILTK